MSEEHTHLNVISDMQGFKGAVMGAKKDGKKCLLQWSASFCMPCKAIKDDLKGFADKYADKMVMHYVDCEAEDMEELQEMYEISSMPSFTMLDGPGAAKAKYEGQIPAKIEEFIVSALE